MYIVNPVSMFLAQLAIAGRFSAMRKVFAMRTCVYFQPDLVFMTDISQASNHQSFFRAVQNRVATMHLQYSCGDSTMTSGGVFTRASASCGLV